MYLLSNNFKLDNKQYKKKLINSIDKYNNNMIKYHKKYILRSKTFIFKMYQ
jgi:hypothetical protein